MSYDYEESRSRLDNFAKVYDDRSRLKVCIEGLRRDNEQFLRGRDGVSGMENAQGDPAEAFDDTFIATDKLLLGCAIAQCHFIHQDSRDRLQQAIEHIEPDAPLEGLRWLAYAWQIYLSAEPGTPPLGVALTEPEREMNDRRDITKGFRSLLESLVSAYFA